MHAHSQTCTAPSLRGLFCNIKATPFEQKLLLTLPEMNCVLVPATFHAERYSTKTGYDIVSVLLPLGPLDFVAIAKSSHNMGRSVCGERVKSRCSQCQSIHYCGTGLYVMTH